MSDLVAPRRGRLRSVRWTRVGHGLYRPRTGAPPDGDDQVGSPGWCAGVAAWRLVLPASGAFTRLTAAALYGWRLPPLPKDLPVFASVSHAESRPRRLREADAVLGRPYRIERLRPWYAALAGSLFTPAGTARPRRRWSLPGGTTTWGPPMDPARRWVTNDRNQASNPSFLTHRSARAPRGPDRVLPAVRTRR